MRRVALLVSVLVLSALLAGCGGSAGETTTTGAASSENGAVVAQSAALDENILNTSGGAPDSAADADRAPQATEEPLAARVNGQPITLATFQRERERRMMGLQIEPATQAAFDANVLSAMIDQVLIEQAAEQLGLVVNGEEVDTELQLQVELAQANGTTLEEVIAAQSYTMDEYREVVRGLLLVQLVSGGVIQVPDTATQVHSRHILVADEATARDLLNQIQAGADFAQLAAQYSLDSSSAPSGGDLGWVARCVLLQQEVEDAIFALQPGELAASPVQSSLGYHVVQTLERVGDRPLSQIALAQRKQQAFLDWLDTQRQAAVIERFAGAVE